MKNIIISGSNRSGSTSLFNYLSKHPSINGSKTKQTNYFIDNNNLTKNTVVPIHYTGNKPYSSIFPNLESQYCLEASPDYLYSKGTPERIKGYFSVPPKILFILREPNSRLKSWYSFGKQIGEVPSDESYEVFLKKCKKNEYQGGISYKAITTGEYYKYIEKYYKFIPFKDIKIVFLEDLKKNPEKVVFSIFDWLGLPKNNYENHEYIIYNPNMIVKNRWLHYLYRNILKIVNQSFLIDIKNIKILMHIKLFVKNKIFTDNETIAVENDESIIDFAEANSKLELLIKEKLPW